jgi:hypothetical protein
MSHFRVSALLPAFLALALLAACATKQVKVGTRYMVTAPKTAFYKYGPAQSFGPDTTLPKGTVVTMLESTWGFCHVMTDTGLSGYVSSDDLKIAPPAAATPPPKLATNTSRPQFSNVRPKPSNIRPTPGGPLFDMSDLPMPLPDSSEPAGPKPKFRY